MDVRLLLWLNGTRGPWLDKIAGFLSSWGYYFPPIAALLVLVGLRRKGFGPARDGLLTWFSASYLAEEVLKGLVHRARPTGVPELLAALHVLGPTPSARSLSFPSGTAAACFAGATWAWLHAGPKVGAGAFVLAGLIGFSRVYAGVHYPSDILGGAALGGLVAAAVWSLTRFDRARRVA